MFAYNPQVQDRSGEILGNAGAASAEIRRQGNVAAAQAVGDAISNISAMYMKKQEQNQANQNKMEGSMTTLNAMNNLSGQYGERGAAFQSSLGKDLAALGEKPDPDKLAGLTMAYTPAFQSLISTDQTQATADIWSKHRASAPVAPGSTTTAPKLDAQYGREFYMGLRNNGRTHEQALQDMRNAGLNWAINDIERPQNQGFFNMPNPPATSTGP